MNSLNFIQILNKISPKKLTLFYLIPALVPLKSGQQTLITMIGLNGYEIVKEICTDGFDIIFQATDRKVVIVF